MPGNEFGERTHNFFGQEGISQDQLLSNQHQSQAVDGSWSSFSNGLVDNQRQINPSLIANLKSFSTLQSVDPERGQSSNSQHGLNFTQQPIRSEYSRSLLQEHQQPTNGYMHGDLVMQASPNEANFLGVDAEPSRGRLSATGFTPELHKNPMRFEIGESPVNYDFFGGQQQLNSQLPGMLQPFPRQQMTNNDIQLLKQQVMVKQMHEYQMQPQLQKQHLDARQLNSFNSNAVNGSHSSDNQSHPLISGIPLQDASSNCWQPDLMTGNTNWMHRGISPIVQGSSSGLMITPEHVQANSLAQQFEPSLYGMPVGGANAPQNAFSSVQMNKLAAQHASANMSSSLTNQPTSFSFLTQGDVQDSHMLPRSTYQEKLLFSHTSVPGSNNRPDFENFQQDDSRGRNISMQEKFGQMEGSGLSDKSYMKVPENVNALQKLTKLDPTEEKILFGSDDNLWDAFGSSSNMSLTGNLMSSNSDLYDACPSLQSGSWSALMQSAVAETSSDDAGVHEWGSKHQSVWASNALREIVSSASTRTAVQQLQDKGNKVSDHGLLEKPVAQHSQMAGNMFHSSSSGIDGQNNSCAIRKKVGIDDRLGIWKAASNPNLAAPMQRANFGEGNDSSTSRDAQGNLQDLDSNSVEKAITQQKFRNSSQILESHACNNASNGMAESNEMGNLSDNFQSKFSAEPFTRGFREITPVNVRDVTMLPGGKETQSPVNNARRFTPSRIGEQYSNFENLVDGLHSVKSSKQLNTVDPSYVVHMQQMSGSIPGAEPPSPESLLHGATDKILKVDKPKKRKTATSGLISWNKEVMQGLQRLKTLGEAEVDWASATNRFTEEVVFETLLEDFPPIRSKRRLIYTTKLMQQLFCSPLARVISLVASSNYEFIVYAAARAAGDACNPTSTDRSERFSSPKNSNPLSERTQAEKTSDHYISKAAEDFISRTRKLETAFAGLETGTTIPDLRVEVQDLERFAMINRFASFHQSSSSVNRSVSSLRLNPQRYVTIAPMPHNIPDRVQCLSF